MPDIAGSITPPAPGPTFQQAQQAQSTFEQGQVIRKARIEAAADVAATQQALQEAQGDVPSAIDTLLKSGKTNPAGTLQKAWDAHVGDVEKAADQHVKTQKATTELVANLLSGVNDQHSLDAVKMTVDPKYASMLPAQYEPGAIDALRKSATSAHDLAEMQHQSFQDLLAAGTDQDKQYQATLNGLGAIRDPQSWDAALKLAAMRPNAPKERLAALPQQFSPDALRFVQDAALSQKERNDAANVAADNKRADAALAVQQGELAVKQQAERRQEGSTPTGAGLGTGATGQAVLDSIPDAGQRGIVKALAEGRMQFPTGAALRAPYWQQMLDTVAKYDPSFDAVNYNARAKTRADFTSGKSAQTVNAINTAIGHLDSLQQAATALGNSSSTWWNGLKNWYSDVTGKPEPKTFEATREAVADELTRVWRGAGGSEADIQERKKQLATASSPAQFKAVIGQLGDLIESKLVSSQQQYLQGMGIKDIQVLTPKSRQVLDKLEGNSPAASVAAPTAPAGLVTKPPPDQSGSWKWNGTDWVKKLPNA